MGRDPKRGRLKKFWGCETNWHFVLCAAELLEKIMVIAHVIGKLESLGTKINKSELDSEWGLLRTHKDSE